MQDQADVPQRSADTVTVKTSIARNLLALFDITVVLVVQAINFWVFRARGETIQIFLAVLQIFVQHVHSMQLMLVTCRNGDI